MGYRVMGFTDRALTKDPAAVLQLVLGGLVVRAWGHPQ